MQIVIDIDTVDYEYIKNGCSVPIKIDNHIYDAIRNGTPVNKDMYIPFIMHKEMDIPLLECQKAYDIAIDYLQRQGKVRG